MTKLTNVSNPAAIGCEADTGTGTRWQFIVLRGVSGVRFAVHNSLGWGPLSSVLVPERFGAQPKTYKELAAWVSAFFAEAE